MTVHGRRTTRRQTGAVRRYDSPQRRARAEATRAAVATAARRLFAERGWSGTTVRDVAREAGVSEPTVYATYGNKAGLANALVDAIASTADRDQQAAELSTAEGDPAAQLAAMIGFDRRLYEHGGGVLAALRDAGRSEPDLAAAYESARAHADHVRHAVLATWPRGALRAGLDQNQAVDTYAALCNIDVYRVLTGERGWSPDRVEAWLHQTLCQLLLA
ncbi:TetR/AcrR family transcriptional regulator [Pseudonocardia phyllosphaerae]|uniref:TetR/AcrR family transcriptional regulator n=1 Tax=Pseudonocardia phyllosphaerae TaxID=3390502 RepID=UPI00397AE67A